MIRRIYDILPSRTPRTPRSPPFGSARLASYRFCSAAINIKPTFADAFSNLASAYKVTLSARRETCAPFSLPYQCLHPRYHSLAEAAAVEAAATGTASPEKCAAVNLPPSVHLRPRRMRQGASLSFLTFGIFATPSALYSAAPPSNTPAAGGRRRFAGDLVLPEGAGAEARLPGRVREPGALARVRVRLVQPRPGLRGAQEDARDTGVLLLFLVPSAEQSMDYRMGATPRHSAVSFFFLFFSFSVFCKARR